MSAEPSWISAFKNLKGYEGELLFAESLAKHTYFKIGGPASLLTTPTSKSDLEILRKLISEKNIPYQILGLGSNLLAPDEGVEMLLVKTTKLNATVESDCECVRTGSGLTVASFLRTVAKEGWDHFEFMSGIPGTIGGVVAMNGGTHLGEAAAQILSVETFSLDSRRPAWKEYSAAELAFSYRKNHFLLPGDLVFSASWKKIHGDSADIREKLDSLYRRRKETQPLEFPSCGSVFKNPTGHRAWEVIDRLGLRGMRIGNAQFADKHPNWILNLGNASAKDVLGLIDLAKTRAQNELGIELQEEVRILKP